MIGHIPPGVPGESSTLKEVKPREFFKDWCRSGGSESYPVEDLTGADRANFDDVARDEHWTIEQAAFVLRGWRLDRVADYSSCLKFLKRELQVDAEADALHTVYGRLRSKFRPGGMSPTDEDRLPPTVDAKVILAWGMSPPFPALVGSAETGFPLPGLVEAVTGEKDSYQELKSKFEQATAEIEKIKFSTAAQTVGKAHKILKFLVLLAQGLFGFEKPGDAAKAYDKMQSLLLPRLENVDDLPPQSVFESWLEEGGQLLNVQIRRTKRKSGFEPGSDS